MAQKFLDSEGVKTLWDKVKTYAPKKTGSNVFSGINTFNGQTYLNAASYINKYNVMTANVPDGYSHSIRQYPYQDYLDFTDNSTNGTYNRTVMRLNGSTGIVECPNGLTSNSITSTTINSTYLNVSGDFKLDGIRKNPDLINSSNISKTYGIGVYRLSNIYPNPSSITITFYRKAKGSTINTFVSYKFDKLLAQGSSTYQPIILTIYSWGVWINGVDFLTGNYTYSSMLINGADGTGMIVEQLM